jgi:hypothetical protein
VLSCVLELVGDGGDDPAGDRFGKPGELSVRVALVQPDPASAAAAKAKYWTAVRSPVVVAREPTPMTGKPTPR